MSDRAGASARLILGRHARGILLGAVALAVLANALAAGIWTRQFRIQGPYGAETGLAWYVPQELIAPPVPWLTVIATDSLAHPESGDVAVADGEGLLGPAHSDHAEIRALGQGRYSYWNGRLLFSTRHGEDPNTVPTELAIAAKVALAPALRLGLTILGTIAAWLLFRDFRRAGDAVPVTASAPARLRGSRFRHWLPPPALGAIAIFAVAFDAVVLCGLPHVIFYSPDSEGYYLFAPIRTAGYGLLLHGAEALFGDPYAMVPFQFSMAILATLVLCTAVRRIFRSSLLAICLGVALTVKQGLIDLHFFIMPDSLFFSCATAALGLALLLLERATLWRLVAAGAVLIAAMLLRPAAIGLYPGLGIVAGLIGRRQKRAAALLVIVLVASLFANIAAEPLAAAIAGRPDAGSGAFSGFVLIGSAGLLLTPDTPTSQPVLRDRLVAALAPVRATWSAARSIAEERDIIVRSQDDVIYRYAVPAACETLRPACTTMAVDAALRGLAVDAIRHDPGGMLAEFVAKLVEDATETFSGAWLAGQRHSMAIARDSLEQSVTGRAWQASHQYDLTPHGSELAPDPFDLGTLLSYNRGIVNAVTLAGAIASIIGCLAGAIGSRFGPPLAALGAAAAGLLGYHVFVCLLEVPLDRYAEPLSAWFLLSLGGSVLLAWRRIGRWLAARRQTVAARP